jgi:hypothetical protein
VGRLVAGLIEPKARGNFFWNKIGFLNLQRLQKFIQGDLGGILLCGFFLNSSRFFKHFIKKMPCHAMHPMQDYFWEDFYMHDKFDMQPICTSMLMKFYSCKKWVLQIYPRLEESHPRDSGSAQE